MVSVENPIFAKFNVDAKPFEMYLPNPHFVRDPLSSESSDSSDYSPENAAAFLPIAYADDSANTNSDGDGPFLDISDPLSDAENNLLAAKGENEADNLFVPPDDDLRERIVKQVEFYFSDVNLTKDAFLLKHVKRNKEGLVSLKLISSFKKVKTLTKDWRVVAYSLKTSDKLVVNDTGTKVGRKDPLPPYDETTPTRTVIAMNLPLDRPTVETVTDLFSKCGDIALTRILRPGAPVPPDIKQFVHKHPGIGTMVCAVIEFTSADGAQRAVSEMGGKNNDWRSMHVVEMVKGKKVVQQGNKKESPKSESGEECKKEEEKKKKRNKKRSPKNDKGLDGLSSGSTSALVGSENVSPNSRRKNEMQTSSPIGFVEGGLMNGKQMFSGQKISPVLSPEMVFRGGKCDNGTSSPWVHRRRLAAKENGQNPLNNRRVEVNGGQNGNSTKLLVPEGVVRMPRGPDGTTGFHGGRGRENSSPLSVLG